MDVVLYIILGILAILGLMLIRALPHWSHSDFTREPSRTEVELLHSRCSEDEELLAATAARWSSTDENLALRDFMRFVAGLTHRRIVVLGFYKENVQATETVIELRHIIDYTFSGGDTINLKTASGKERTLNLYGAERGRAFADTLRELLERESRTHALLGVGTELEKLGELVSRGILSPGDLDRAKGLLLGKPVSAVQESVELLESIYRLHKQGVLSESEFNMKKWDILSK